MSAEEEVSGKMGVGWGGDREINGVLFGKWMKEGGREREMDGGMGMG